MGKATKFELEYLKKEKVAKNTYSFYFNRKKLADFDFLPGQYLKLAIDINDPDKRGTSRYFTISSSPTDKEFIAITTKIIKSSFKLALANLKPGDKIRAFGPIGYFNFDQNDKNQNIFISGGLGITPYHSLLRFLTDRKIKSNIILFASFVSRDEIIFFNELKNIERKNNSIKIIYTLTGNENHTEDFMKGRIDSGMIKEYADQYKTANYFLVGPLKMIDSMFLLIKNMGVSEEKIFKEDFPGY